MRRLSVLGCTLLLVAGCGEGGRAGEEVMPVDPPAPVGEATLHITGEARPAPVDVDVDGDGDGDGTTAHFHNWGVWGGVLRDDVVTCTAIGCPPAGDEIFWAYLSGEADGTTTTTVHGTLSGTSPVGGSAVWSGGVHAFETETVATAGATPVTTYAPVTGDARLEVDFTAGTIDVGFTNLGEHRADLAWPSLAMDMGAFGNAAAGLEGAFYGADHEGVAGTFVWDGLTGVFGALRAPE